MGIIKEFFSAIINKILPDDVVDEYIKCFKCGEPMDEDCPVGRPMCTIHYESWKQLMTKG